MDYGGIGRLELLWLVLDCGYTTVLLALPYDGKDDGILETFGFTLG